MKFRDISKIFPAPRFLGGYSLGIDISDKSIKYVAFAPYKGELMVKMYGKEPIPEGVITRGSINDQAKIKEILKRIKEKTRATHIRAALPEEKLYLFNLNIPKVNNTEARDTISLSLEQYVPIANTDLVFDYDFIEEHNGEQHFQVGVIPRETIDSYLELFDGTGLIPISFEVEAQALARAVVDRQNQGAVMIVDMGETRTGISIAYKGYVLFTSTVDIGGHHFDMAIMKHFGIEEPEAVSRKEKYGIRQGMSEESSLLPAVANTLSALKDEINKHFIFWSSHPFDNGIERPKIEKIIICGGEANLSGLVDYMTEAMGMRVEKANPFININTMKNYVPDMHFKESMAYTTAFGLALADYQYD